MRTVSCVSFGSERPRWALVSSASSCSQRLSMLRKREKLAGNLCSPQSYRPTDKTDAGR